mmetsp:Transcript_56209/g.159367  ORF Transcript_56209/g.159367 Transcript_56209/m.159367 type:complete len:215 (+) Transcript_56209:685-1329(+)
MRGGILLGLLLGLSKLTCPRELAPLALQARKRDSGLEALANLGGLVLAVILCQGPSQDPAHGRIQRGLVGDRRIRDGHHRRLRGLRRPRGARGGLLSLPLLAGHRRQGRNLCGVVRQGRGSGVLLSLLQISSHLARELQATHAIEGDRRLMLLAERLQGVDDVCLSDRHLQVPLAERVELGLRIRVRHCLQKCFGRCRKLWMKSAATECCALPS